MANSKLMEIAIAIKGKLDSSLPSSFKQTAASMRDLQRQASELRKQTKDVGRWKEQAESLRAITTQYRDAQQRVRAAAQAFESTGRSSQMAKRNLDEARLAVTRLGEKVSEQRARLHALSDNLRQAGVDTRNLAKSQQALDRATARNDALIARQRALNSAKKTQARASGNLYNSVGNVQSGIGVAATVAAPLVGAISTAANFQAAMSKVQAITRSNSEEMQRLTANARMLGETTQFSATQAADAMSYLGMAGWNADQIIAGMPGLLALAAAGGTDLARTADIVSDDLTAFGLDAGQAGHMADVFAVTVTRTNTNVEMLGETMKYAAPVAKAFGASMEETAALAGLMANSGIKASQAGTALRAGFLRLAGPPKMAGKAMEELGINMSDVTAQQEEARAALEALGITMSDTNGPRKMSTILTELYTKLQGLGQEEQLAQLKAIFGTEAATGWLAVINQGPEAFNNLVTAMENSDGEADKMAKVMMNNAKGAGIQLKSALESLAISVGSVFLPGLTSAAQAGAELAGRLSRLASANPKIVAALAAVAAAVTGVVLAVLSMAVVSSFINYTSASFALLQSKALGAAGSVLKLVQSMTISNVLSAASNGFRAVGTAIGTMSKAALGFLFSPAGAVLAALAVAAYLIYTNWDKVGPFFADLWNTVSNAFSSAYASIQPALAALSGAWSALVQAFSQSGVLEPLMERIGALVNLLGGALFGAFILVANVAAGVLVAAIQTAAQVIEGLVNVITGVVQIVTGILNGDWSLAWAGAQRVVQGAVDVIEGIVGGMGNFIQGIIDGVANGFRSIINLAKGAGSSAQNVPTPGMSAAGGVFTRPYLTWVAEAGKPEVIVPIDNTARAASLWQTAGAMLGMLPDTQGTISTVSPALEPVKEPVSSTTSSSVTVNFSPTVNVSGGGNIEDQVNAALARQAAQFEARFQRMLDNAAAERRRLSFE